MRYTLVNTAHEALLGKLVLGWHLPYDRPNGSPWALPKDDPTVLDDLTDEDNDLLEQHADELMKRIQGSAPAPDDEQLDDPASPTTPASA